ncbi:MAG TPA: DnaJ domain-containing protein [Candidatus Anaerotruncus excrementipullorum]|uniref:DnaJ domain-containing protein n=1 Tax=Candidatus Anaerotruncus excrementipullorum TaxID=2838465 RepID=A0A9D2B7M1_9FIRM|nr:DnaJ domain-containing protein [Candidatus Anaerotruncus excrementipullorum]
MTDPYKVLGVSPNATDEQVKSAYRELAKKYHPDNYANNPLADLAQEKMQEINQAYDTIMAQRKRGGGGGYQSSGPSAGGYSQFSDIRRLINAGRIAEAQELLDGVAAANRDAEWYFLKGSIYYSRGWLDDALQCFQRACSMNPQNTEYSAAYNQLLWQRQTGQPRQYGGMGAGQPYVGGCSCCDVCAAMYCASCCSDCCSSSCF